MFKFIKQIYNRIKSAIQSLLRLNKKPDVPKPVSPTKEIDLDPDIANYERDLVEVSHPFTPIDPRADEEHFKFRTNRSSFSVIFPFFNEDSPFHGTVSFDKMIYEFYEIDPTVHFSGGKSYTLYLFSPTKAQEVKNCIYRHLASQRALALLP